MATPQLNTGGRFIGFVYSIILTEKFWDFDNWLLNRGRLLNGWPGDKGLAVPPTLVI